MAVSKTYDVVVVGAGMMGSAAAKYLAVAGMKTLLVGPCEGNASGVHGSHHDEARITRFSGPDETWSRLAAASIRRYPEIESVSGVKFHTACGHLRCDLPRRHARSQVTTVRHVLDGMQITAVALDREEVTERFPYLHFAPESEFHFESGPAGIIHPRMLVRAQIAMGKRHGMTLLRDIVPEITRMSDHFEVGTASGTVLAENVLVAAGSYTSLMRLLPSHPAFSVRPETVLLVRVDEKHAHEWSNMPGIIWNFDHHPEVPYAYVLPPVRYPDGYKYIKIGADHDKDVQADSVAAIDDYMTGEGSQRTALLLYGLVQELVPDLRGAPWRSKPCMLTYTGHGYPYIDEVEKGWFVAAGGCGKSAKSSDQIGYLASRLVLGRSWPEAFKRSLFSVSCSVAHRKTAL